MNFFSILAAIGMLAVAGFIGFGFAWLEDKAWEEDYESKRK